MLERFKKFISKNKLIIPGEKILLAVSGGIDSMVMTHLFLQLKHNIGIAHCNFTLRGKESDMDEEMVRMYAEKIDVPFYSQRFNTKAIAAEQKLSVQMAARKLRYEWFEELCNEKGYKKIAIAHNLNDNIETVFLNLTRGTGIKGLTGIKPIAGKIIRPLLFATRDEIIRYCNEHKVIFREDKSNAETKYSRNKIRHQVIPALKEINPSLENSLQSSLEIFNGTWEIVSEYVKSISERVIKEKGELTIIEINKLKPYLSNKTVIFELFAPYGITNLLMKDLMNIITGKTGSRILTNTHKIVKNRSEIIIAKNNVTDSYPQIIEDINDLNKASCIAAVIYTDLTEEFSIPSDSRTACIDFDKLVFPLVIRRWKAGDLFYPLGMKNRKKLSDYFIDNKYSIIDKENKLVIESKDKIVCIIGDRIDNNFRVTEFTRKVLIIEPSDS